MTEQERLHNVENRVDVLAAKVDAFIEEIRDFKKEMRDRDNQRAAETVALRAETEAKMAALRTETETKMTELRKETAEIDSKRSAEIKEIKDELKNLDKYFHNLTLTAMVGVGAAVIGLLVGVGAMAFAVLFK